MKKNYLKLLLLAGVLTSLQSMAQLTATLEELTLEPESYWNGSDGNNSFTSGPVTFRNLYNAEYFYWSGFSYSNITDNTTAGYTNQYSCISGKGALSSLNYAVGYVMVADTITLKKPTDMFGMYVTNSAYTALSMKNGDDYAKKFGGESGNDEDWFKLTIKGWNSQNQLTGTVDFYLADYRFSENSMDYIISDWVWVDLTGLKGNMYITFELSSTDIGDWGMNTPGYFCADQITVKDYTQIDCMVDNSTSGIEGVTVSLDDKELTTDINGNVSFENVSPTTQMVVKATKEGFATYETIINGYFTTSLNIHLTATAIDKNQASEFVLYPNPAAHWVTVTGKEPILQIHILNISGQQIYSFEGTGDAEQTLFIPLLKSGIYLVEVNTPTGKTIQKLFKQ